MKTGITALNKCACIDTLFTELPWRERFQAAGQSGFTHVEFWDWRGKDLNETKRAAEAAGIGISGFNGDADYSLVDPSHKRFYLDDLQRSMEAAKKIGAQSVTIHSNALGEGGVVKNHYDELSHTVKLCSMFDMLTACVQIAEEYDVRMNLEALNTVTDHAGNFLRYSRDAAEVTRLIGSPLLKILFDVYHMQLNEGCLCENLTYCADQLGHIHIADAPGRHEPGTGEINYKKVIAHLKNIGYTGLLGYELFPEKDTETAVKAIMREM